MAGWLREEEEEEEEEVEEREEEASLGSQDATFAWHLQEDNRKN